MDVTLAECAGTADGDLAPQGGLSTYPAPRQCLAAHDTRHARPAHTPNKMASVITPGRQSMATKIRRTRTDVAFDLMAPLMKSSTQPP
jgi:hypothetical protein